MSKQGSEMSKRPPPRVWWGESPELHNFHSPQSSRSGAGVGVLKPQAGGLASPPPTPSCGTSKREEARAEGRGVNLWAPRSCEHRGAPARSHQVSSAGRVARSACSPRPRPALLAAGGFHVDQGGKMTSLLTDRYTETWLVIYWLSAPDESH